MSGYLNGLGRLGSPWVALEFQTQTLFAEIKGLCDEIARFRKEAGEAAAKALADDIAARVRLKALLTQEQAAWVLNVSTKHLRNLEHQGKIERCPNIGGAVGYPASDVLKLASAKPWKED